LTETVAILEIVSLHGKVPDLAVTWRNVRMER
jgi:hypothetical protein